MVPRNRSIATTKRERITKFEFFFLERVKSFDRGMHACWFINRFFKQIVNVASVCRIRYQVPGIDQSARQSGIQSSKLLVDINEYQWSVGGT